MENKDKYTVEVIVPYLGNIKVATFYFHPSYDLVESTLSSYEEKLATSIERWRIRRGRKILEVQDRLLF